MLPWREMKTKIKVTKITDKDTKVSINSPVHRIEEIKKEISECFMSHDFAACETEVFEMWEDK
jgi:hypothetical protein